MKKAKLALLCMIAIMVSCNSSNKMDLVLSPSTATLHHDEQQYVHIVGEPTNAVWTTDDEFVAKVDNGTITGNHVGTTIVRAQINNQKGTCAVTVKPKYYTYNEPLTNWSLTRNDIIAMKGTPYRTDGSKIYYQQAEKIFECYDFENGVMSNSAVILPITYISVADFLLERYELYYSEKRQGVDIYYFINALSYESANLLVALGVQSSQNLLMVAYAPANTGVNKIVARISKM